MGDGGEGALPYEARVKAHFIVIGSTLLTKGGYRGPNYRTWKVVRKSHYSDTVGQTPGAVTDSN